MNKQQIQLLLAKYLEDQCTDKERALVESWYRQQGIENHSFSSSEDLGATERLLWGQIASATVQPKTRVIRLWRIAAAAAVVVMVGLGLYFYQLSRTDALLDAGALAHIRPGKNTATLTLADGKQIALSEAKSGVVIGQARLNYSDGSKVVNGFAGGLAVQQLTASTPKGGQYQFELPDGTKVWLNAASRLKFPSSFAGLSQRVVELAGEAYFEVAKKNAASGKNQGERLPFLVRSAQQTVEVLGTHFNVSAYGDEPTTLTTLVEGSVRVAGISGNAVKVLKPDEQSALTDSGPLSVREIDADEAVAWKNGKFVFNSQELRLIMKKVARWYNVQVVFEGEVERAKLSGSLSRFDNIATLLNTLQATGEANFTVKGNTITVSEK